MSYLNAMSQGNSFFLAICKALVLLAVMLICSAMGRLVEAHPPVSSIAHITISPQGKVIILIQYDAVAFALNKTSSEISDDEVSELWKSTSERFSDLLRGSENRWKSDLLFLADESEIPLAISQTPTLDTFREWKNSVNGLPHPEAMQIELHTTLPVGSKRVSVRFPEILDFVLLVIERPGLQRSILPLDPGDLSPPIDVTMVHSTNLEVSAAIEDQTLTDQNPSYLPPELPRTSWYFLRQGFLHIIPFGADHALFVLGLFLLVTNWKFLLLQISAFTIAHTVTMTLASLQWFAVSPRVVEPLIALSILVVAIENLLPRTTDTWKVLTAFGFGLIHGLGFASILVELQLPINQVMIALASFGIGVEIGHITILCIAFLLLGWSRHHKWYRVKVAIPISIGIGATALYLLIDRLVIAS